MGGLPRLLEGCVELTTAERAEAQRLRQRAQFDPRSAHAARTIANRVLSWRSPPAPIALRWRLVLLFRGGFGYRRWGYGGGIGIGGILLIVLIVYLLIGRGGL